MSPEHTCAECPACREADLAWLAVAYGLIFGGMGGLLASGALMTVLGRQPAPGLESFGLLSLVVLGTIWGLLRRHWLLEAADPPAS